MKSTNKEFPEIVRRALRDHGIGDDVITACNISWDGDHVVIPVRDDSGVIQLSIALWDAHDFRTLRA